MCAPQHAAQSKRAPAGGGGCAGRSVGWAGRRYHARDEHGRCDGCEVPVVHVIPEEDLANQTVEERAAHTHCGRPQRHLVQRTEAGAGTGCGGGAGGGAGGKERGGTGMVWLLEKGSVTSAPLSSTPSLPRGEGPEAVSPASEPSSDIFPLSLMRFAAMRAWCRASTLLFLRCMGDGASCADCCSSVLLLLSI